jgi:hyperosmotically inducible protein
MNSTFPLMLAGALLLPLGACATQPCQQANSAATRTSPSPGSSVAAPDAPYAHSPAAAAGPSTSLDSAASMAQPQSIVARIRSEMAAQDVASLPDISVDTDASGAVVLSGTAQSQEDVNKTVSIARSTAGVTSVTNDIKVKSPG